MQSVLLLHESDGWEKFYRYLLFSHQYSVALRDIQDIESIDIKADVVIVLGSSLSRLIDTSSRLKKNSFLKDLASIAIVSTRLNWEMSTANKAGFDDTIPFISAPEELFQKINYHGQIDNILASSFQVRYPASKNQVTELKQYKYQKREFLRRSTYFNVSKWPTAFQAAGSFH